jgi:hypothetical protein
VSKIIWENGEKKIVPLSDDERLGAGVSRMQALIALQNAGLLSAAESYMQNADAVSQIAWQHATTFYRKSDLINSVGAALGLTPQDIDDLFASAADVEL